jgi:hypothetical protein
LEIVADLEKEQGRGLNGIEKEPTTVDLHAGARKAIMVSGLAKASLTPGSDGG